MSTYAILDASLTSILARDELSAERFAALAPAKRQYVRLFVADAKPLPSAAQVVVEGPLVVGPTEVHQTFVLRTMTAEEAEAAAIQTERLQLTQYIVDIQAQLDVTNAARAAMTTNQRFNALEADTRATMKAVKFLLRQAKRTL